MAVQQTGVQFVNAGLGSTLQGLNLYQAALVRTTQTVITSTQKINNSYQNISSNTTKNFSLIGNLSADFSRNMNVAHAGVLRFGTGLKNLFLTMVGFYALKRAANELLDVFQDLFKSMLEGASDTQLLTIRFQNLTAISIQQTQGIKDYGQALEMARGPALSLLEWANQMAVKTPFSRHDVATVLSLGMAFDLTAGQSKTLTNAMMNWAAGMGLGNDALQRMVINFGQMMRMGKITQRELRDLAIGGLFPVNEALRRIGEQSGMTGDALKKFMSDTATSGVPVEALLNTFVEIAGERFPNAAEQMAKTWQGVTQNIKDFVTTILGASILGPTMNKVVNSLSDALDKALSPSVRAAAQVIGVHLADALEKVVGIIKSVIGLAGQLGKAFGLTIPSIEQVIAGIDVFVNAIQQGMQQAVGAVQSWITTSGNAFAEGAKNFLNWGMEMVTQFALGIIEGAVTALTAAMDVIAAILSFFMGPGSPPRIAPNIDEWGISAMNEFLHGMTLADFDILNDLQGPIKAALNALVTMGKLAQDQVGRIYADISRQIMLAMRQLEKTGKVGEAVFRAIRKAGGAFGKELEELARAQFKLLAAMKEVEKAKKALNEAQKADDAARKKVDALTQEYRDLVAAGASDDILNAKRQEIKAAMDERDVTREAVQEGEERVKTAEDALEPLQDAVKLQEELVKEMLEMVEAQKEVTAGGKEAGAGFGAGLGDALKDFEDNLAWAQNVMAIKQIEMNMSIETWVSNLNKKMGELFKPLEDKWATLEPAFVRLGASFDNLSTKIDTVFGGNSPLGKAISGQGTLGKFVNTLGKIVGGLWVLRTVLGILSWPFKTLFGIIGSLIGVKGLGGLAGAGTVLSTVLRGLAIVIGIVTSPIFLLIAAITTLVLAVISNWEILKKDFEAWVRLVVSLYYFIIRKVGEFISWAVTGLSNAAGEVAKFVNGIVTAISNFFSGLPGTIGTYLASFINTIGLWLAQIGLLWNWFWSTGVGEFLKNIWEGATGILAKIGEWLGTLFNTVIKAVTDLLGETGLLPFIQKFVDMGVDFIQGIIDGVGSMGKALLEGIVGVVEKAINGVLDFLGIPHSPSLLATNIGKDVMEGYALGIQKGTQGTIDAMVAAAGKISAAGQVSLNASVSGRRAVTRPSITYNSASNRTTNYNLAVNTLKSAGNVARDFAIMEVLAG